MENSEKKIIKISRRNKKEDKGNVLWKRRSGICHKTKENENEIFEVDMKRKKVWEKAKTGKEKYMIAKKKRKKKTNSVTWKWRKDEVQERMIKNKL